MKSNEGPAKREGKKSFIHLEMLHCTKIWDVQHSQRSQEDLEADGGLSHAESRQDHSGVAGRLVHSSKRP